MPEELFMWQDTYLENNKNGKLFNTILTDLSLVDHFMQNLNQKPSN